MFTSKQYTHHWTHHPNCRDFIKTIVRKNPAVQQLADEIAATLIVNQEVLAAEPQDTQSEFVIQDNNVTIQNPQQPTIQLANHPC
jgi:Ulp1 family protease